MDWAAGLEMISWQVVWVETFREWRSEEEAERREG